MNRILQAIAGLRSDLADLRCSVEHGLASLDAKISTLRVEVMDRIDRPQDQLTARREGDVVVFDAAERAEKVAISTREEVHSLSHQLNSLTRLVKMLQNRMDDFANRNGPAP